MIKKSFIGLTKPRFIYESTEGMSAEPEKIPEPKKVTLFIKGNYDRQDLALIKTGDKVNTGQKLLLYEDCDEYAISSVTGTVSSVSSYTGDFGQSYAAVSITVSGNEEDEQCKKICKELTLENATDYLLPVPGCPSLKSFSNPEKPIDIIVICGLDSDLLVTTNQHVIKSETYAIDRGISALKKITGAGNVIIALPPHLTKAASGIGGASGAEIRVIDSEYPSALPHMIAAKILGKAVPAGASFEDMGMCFFSAEAVASVGKAVEGRLPVTKTLTLIKKDMSKVMVEAKIGTPISDIFNACDVTLKNMDRIIIGGPMRGSSVFSEDHPVQADTDAIMVQDSEDVSLVSDYPCVNCGECIRICPANVPVSMIVRLCEAEEYETAADQYDLYSCIECGLCSFVCTAKMPIFQYIRLAKYELAKVNAMEQTEEEETEAADA
ncbi:MAG: electron transport complex protein RnfC [Desulfobacterales bacterium]|nr:electron transport complex protein RnfC [Desulfobacterales bacterium]